MTNSDPGIGIGLRRNMQDNHMRRTSVQFIRPIDGTLQLRNAELELQNIKRAGHDYVDLRQHKTSGGIVFSCLICRQICHSALCLLNHCENGGHKKLIYKANTFLKIPHPWWPFNDGVLFLNNRRDKLSHVDQFSVSSGVQDTNEDNIVIAGILWESHLRDLVAKPLGSASMSFSVKKEGRQSLEKLIKAWMTWSGDNDGPEDYQYPRSDSDHETNQVEENCFPATKLSYAVVVFTYTDDLARRPVRNAVQQMDQLKYFSDPEDSSIDSLELSTLTVSVERLQIGRIKRIVRNSVELHTTTRYKRVCGICNQLLHPGKDVATLYNFQSGKVACATGNIHGLFHLFHVSCLLQWILMCQGYIEILENRPEKKRRKVSQSAAADNITTECFDTVICPSCGAGGRARNNGDGGLISIMRIRRAYLSRILRGRRGWMENPEVLTNCSVGLSFYPKYYKEEAQQIELAHKLYFYKPEIDIF